MLSFLELIAASSETSQPCMMQLISLSQYLLLLVLETRCSLYMKTCNAHLVVEIYNGLGVYGDCGGALVDEDCPVNPKMESAKLRLVAENGWLHLGHELGSSINVFRLGGIYGLGRSALDTIIKRKFLSKKQKMRESRIYTSRVHVADIYQSIKASFNVPSSGRIYNVVDDDPAPRAEVFAFAQDLIEKKWPGVIMDIGATAADIDSLEEDSAGEKRVSNARIKNELGVRLVYPSYREGLESIIGSMDTPSSHL